MVLYVGSPWLEDILYLLEGCLEEFIIESPKRKSGYDNISCLTLAIILDPSDVRSDESYICLLILLQVYESLVFDLKCCEMRIAREVLENLSCHVPSTCSEFEYHDIISSSDS